MSSVRVVCTCVSRGCGEGQHRSEDGTIQPGLRVSRATRRAHDLEEQRNKSMIRATRDLIENPSVHYLAMEHPNNDQLHHTTVHGNFPATDSLTNALSGLSIHDPHDHQIQESNTDRPVEYDCSSFFNVLLDTNPVILLMSLKTALVYLTQPCSTMTTRYLLKLDRSLIELVVSQGLDPYSLSTRTLTGSEKAVLNSLPKDPRVIIKHLKIDPDLTYLICCTDCFAMYASDSSTNPEHCIHRQLLCDDDADQDQADKSGQKVCGAPLFYATRVHDHKPIRQFAFQNLQNWLARLFSRHGIEDYLNQTAIRSHSPYDPAADIDDIQASRIWKEFQGPDGQQFTAQSGNVTFGMFMDAINPYGNRQAGKHASVTFIIMICLTLPVSLRYLPENIFLVGVAPGPKEPSLEQVNWILQPVIEQLRSLWSPGLFLSRTSQHPEGRLIRAALLPFFADLPALRRALGFAAPSATRMCSYCLLKKSDIANINPTTWPLRSLDQHRYWAKKSLEASSLKQKEAILLNHGVRYSVLLELPYWNILEFHVVDSMHNLLLGLLKWHCQRFWLMSDVDEEKEPPGVSTKELRELIADSTAKLPKMAQPSPLEEDDFEGIPFAELLFGSITDPSDDDFVPAATGDEWGGKWVPPSDGIIIFDRTMLLQINAHLKRIHIPTWIQRAIPMLGKASFGRLKADEWRNLFTIQLPLVLPVLWNDGNPDSQSLLHNFAHLVSLVNLALKRVINDKIINNYRHHIDKYIESCLILFQDVTLAPNHHMAFHLADCLEKFGPSRAWWSFSMERLMGKILKASNNNQITQMEITFLKTFYRSANLKALLESPDLPPAIRPFIRQIKTLYDPVAHKPLLRIIKNGTTSSLDTKLFKALIDRINELFPLDKRVWIASDKWVKLKPSDLRKFARLNARVTHLSYYAIGEVVFSTMKHNENNCVVALKENSKANYGIIEDIFCHSRESPLNNEYIQETWLVIRPLVPVSSKGEPFAHLANRNYSINVSLRRIDRESAHKLAIIHVSEILAHCAWMKYNPQELTTKLDEETIALVTLDR